MKLSQIEKRIPQTLANSKDVIQKGREYARRSSRARSTRGQENEAWALYKKNPSRESRGDLSRDRCMTLPKLATPAGNTFARGLLLTWDKRDSPKQTTCSSPRVKMRKKHERSTPGHPEWILIPMCSQAMKSRFCKNPKDRCFCWFPAAIFLPLNETPTWRLHTKLYKFG